MRSNPIAFGVRAGIELLQHCCSDDGIFIQIVPIFLPFVDPSCCCVLETTASESKRETRNASPPVVHPSPRLLGSDNLSYRGAPRAHQTTLQCTRHKAQVDEATAWHEHEHRQRQHKTTHPGQEEMLQGRGGIARAVRSEIVWHSSGFVAFTSCSIVGR